MDKETTQQLAAKGVQISLTHLPLDATAAISTVKSPKAGAIVLFAGS